MRIVKVFDVLALEATKTEVKIVVPATQVIADDKDAAILKFAVANADKLQGEGVQIQARPFC